MTLVKYNRPMMSQGIFNLLEDIFSEDENLPFEFKKTRKKAGLNPPAHDETLYEMD